MIQTPSKGSSGRRSLATPCQRRRATCIATWILAPRAITGSRRSTLRGPVRWPPLQSRRPPWPRCQFQVIPSMSLRPVEQRSPYRGVRRPMMAARRLRAIPLKSPVTRPLYRWRPILRPPPTPIRISPPQRRAATGSLRSIASARVCPSTVVTATTSSRPTVAFTAAEARVEESAGTYQISVTSSAHTLRYTLSGTATQGTDYTIKALEITILDDADDEPDETVIVTLAATDAYGLANPYVFTLTIADNDLGLTFADSIADQSYRVGLTIDGLTLPEPTGGTRPYSYALTPALPKGLTFDPAMRTIGGTPTEALAPTAFTYLATDANKVMGQRVFTIEVIQPDALVFADTLADQRVPVALGLADIVLPAAAGGIAPYTYTLTPDLPAGLTFEADTRILSGRPTETADAKAYTYAATDRAGVRTQQTFTLEVYRMVFTETIDDQSYRLGETITELVLPEATGGTPPISYTLTLLDLPSLLEFDQPTRTISGTPTQVTPPVELTYRATDINGAQDSLTFSIKVLSPVSTEKASELPQQFTVYPNYPNPFNQTTHLVFDLPWTAQVQVEVTDVTGRQVMALPSRELSAGWGHEIALNALHLPSGMYLYRIQAVAQDEQSTHTGHFMRIQ